MLATPDQQISLTDPDARSMATRSVSPVVGYLTHNDQMMVGLHGTLNVVADDAQRPRFRSAGHATALAANHTITSP